MRHRDTKCSLPITHGHQKKKVMKAEETYASSES